MVGVCDPLQPGHIIQLSLSPKENDTIIVISKENDTIIIISKENDAIIIIPNENDKIITIPKENDTIITIPKRKWHNYHYPQKKITQLSLNPKTNESPNTKELNQSLSQ